MFPGHSVRSPRITFSLSALLTLTLCAACNDEKQINIGSKTLLDSCPTISIPTRPAGSLPAVVDGVATKTLKEKGLPGMAIAIAKDGVLLYAQGYGYADLKSCIRTGVDTPYAIGSVTKQFTAAAILQLQDAGKVSLDSPVIRYLPTYAFDPRITLRMLLNQTSGLADYLEFPKPADWLKGLPQSLVLNAIIQAPLSFAPGAAFEYSNSNYFVLGAVIESVTSAPYADYVAAKLLQPAFLTLTSYQPPLRAAKPYSYANPAVPGTKGLAVGMVPDASSYFATGALWSTVADLATWNAALRQGKIISPRLWPTMTTPPTGVPNSQNAAEPSAYAMGLIAQPVLGRKFVWHNGQSLAYSSFSGQFLDNGFSISIVTNVDVQDDTPLLDVADDLIRSICLSSTTAGIC